MKNYAVVDASLAVKWVLEEEDSEEARRLSNYWSSMDVQPAAPRLLVYEVANVLHLKIRGGQSPIEEALKAFTNFIASDIELIDTGTVHARAVEIANQLNQGAVYDAHYLALAEHLDCEFWTADRAFARASAGITKRVRVLASR